MTFADFWACYPKKVAKLDAEKAWAKLTMFDRDAVNAVIDAHLAIWRRREAQFIPHAGTWLRARRWEDEIPRDRPKVGSPEYYARGDS